MFCKIKFKCFLAGLPAAFLLLSVSSVGAQPFSLDHIELPEGFRIEVYALDVPNARSMTTGPKGTLFVGTRTAGNVYAVQDTDHDYRADNVIILIGGMRAPNGVAVKDGDLYFAEVSRIWRFRDIENNLTTKPRPELIYGDLPQDGHHGWKFIAFGPDGKLYVPVGAPCNVCEREDDRYSSIMRMEPDGSSVEVFAHGVRNTVGFDWHPETGVLWFTDNGRDMMGDNIPPDELNRAPQKGMHFGFPYCHGRDVRDPKFGFESACEKYVPAALELGPHVAALGMQFYTGTMFPEEYRGQIFIAEHGSWNRSSKIGYRIMLVRLDENNTPVSYEPFATGWLQGEEVSGRPVDLEILDDGSMLVSDDYAGKIYRITYEADK